MRRAVVIPLALVALAAALAGCGKSGAKIPRSDARELVARLQEAERRNDPLRCDDLSTDTIPALERGVANLPSKTDSGIRDTLEEGIGHLRDLISAECQAKNESKPPTTTTDTTPTTTETAPQTTTQTQPPSTQTTQPPSTQTQPPSTSTGPSGGIPPGQQKKLGKDKEKGD